MPRSTLFVLSLLIVYVCCAGDDAYPEWNRQGKDENTPSPRYDFAYDYSPTTNRFYVFGGQTSSGTIDDFYAYEIKPQEWKPLPQGPSARRGASASFCFGKLYLFGGNNGSQIYNDMWEFDEKKEAWTYINSFEDMYLTAGSLLCGRRLLYVGGLTLNETYSGTTHVFDEVALTWKISSTCGPEGRIWSPMAWAAKPYNQSFLFGGYGGSDPQFDDFWTLSSRGAGWARMEHSDSWPSSRSGHSTVWLAKEKSFVMFGGVNDNGDAMHDLWFWHIEARVWASLSLYKTPPKRLGAGAVAVGRNIYVFGGISGRGKDAQILDDLWVLNGSNSLTAFPFLALFVLYVLLL